MSVVVAIKDKDRFVLGADKQSTCGNLKSENETKLWTVPELEDAIIGAVGTVRAIQLIRYCQLFDKNTIPEKLSTRYIVNHVVPWIVKTLQDNQVECSITDSVGKFMTIPASFIIAYKDGCWIINNDLSVSEVYDYTAIGSGNEIALGALYATQGNHPFARAVVSIEAASQKTITVSHYLDVLTTSDHDDDDEYAKKYFSDLEVVEEDVKKKKRK